MLVPSTLLQFPNHELLFSVGTFTSYNIGCCVLQPDVSPPREGTSLSRLMPSVDLASEEVPGRVSPSLAGTQVPVLCAAWNPEADGVGPGGPSGSSSGQCWRGGSAGSPSDALHSLV